MAGGRHTGFAHAKARILIIRARGMMTAKTGKEEKSMENGIGSLQDSDSKNEHRKT